MSQGLCVKPSSQVASASPCFPFFCDDRADIRIGPSRPRQAGPIFVGSLPNFRRVILGAGPGGMIRLSGASLHACLYMSMA